MYLNVEKCCQIIPESLFLYKGSKFRNQLADNMLTLYVDEPTKANEINEKRESEK